MCQRAELPSTGGPEPSLGGDSGIWFSLTGQRLTEHPRSLRHPQLLADTAQAHPDACVSPSPRTLIYSISLETYWILLTEKDSPGGCGQVNSHKVTFFSHNHQGSFPPGEYEPETAEPGPLETPKISLHHPKHHAVLIVPPNVVFHSTSNSPEGRQ